MNIPLADPMRLFLTDPTMAADTVSLVIVEPSGRFSHERLHQLVKSSLPQLACFRSRLVDKPLGVGQPVWAEIDDYDPTSQIHRATIRPPGGQREFAELIAQLSAGPHDRRKKLWDAWSIDGLAGGRWALAVQLSPALNDGGDGAASVWSRLLCSNPRDSRANDHPAQPSLGSPSRGALVADMMTELLENQVQGLYLIAEILAGVLRAAAHGQLHGANEPDPMPPEVSSMSGPLPRTVFNAPMTERRAVAFTSIPLADLKTVSNAFGGNITNVFLAACTLSLRAWLQRHDSVPDDPLQMRMPLALPGAARSTFGNPVGRIRIPVQLDDPIEVLTNLHTATERVNTTHLRDTEKSGPGDDLARIASLLPLGVVRAARRICTRVGLRQRLTPICHGSVSYASGQPAPAYCAGAKVVGMQTVAPLLEGRGLDITLTMRRKVMDVSVCVCPDNVPAVDDIATGIADSLDILVAAARKSPRGQGRSVVTEMTSHATHRRHVRRR